MKLTLQQLEAHLWGAANILRGKTAGQDYKNYILSLMFYKRLCDQWEWEADDAIAELERQQGRSFTDKEKAVFRKRGENRRKLNRSGQDVPAGYQRVKEVDPRLGNVGWVAGGSRGGGGKRFADRAGCFRHTKPFGGPCVGESRSQLRSWRESGSRSWAGLDLSFADSGDGPRSSG